MDETIEIVQVEWAFLVDLPDLLQMHEGAIRHAAEEDYAHELHLTSSGRLRPGESGTYGPVRPWPTGRHLQKLPEDEQQLVGAFVDGGETDDYVVISEGTRNGRPLLSRDIDAGHFYPERLFVWGHDEELQPLRRSRLLGHLKALGIRSDPGFWDPCLPWRGFNRGFPTFFEALRCCAQLGPRWWEVKENIEKSDNPNYHWDHYPKAGQRGTLHYYDQGH